jgi:hypothetical protein
MRRVTIPVVLALLAVPTCASVPVYAPRDGTVVTMPLPPIPKWVPSRVGPIPVRRIHHLYCNNAPAWGCYLYATREIQLEDTLSLLSGWVVLRHEIGHSALDQAGVQFRDPDAENRVVQAMAEQQVSEMLSGWP